MEEIITFTPHRPLPKLHPHRRRPANPQAPRLSLSLHIKPPNLPKITILPSPQPSIQPSIQEKLLFLDSLGLDLFTLPENYHSTLASAPLPTLRAAANFLLRDLALSPAALRRIATICPPVLTQPVNSLAAVATFLLTEAGLDHRNLPHALLRRPRLLVSSVPLRLRPTLYFLQSLRLPHIPRHTYLLSCSVEDKLIPRLHFLESSGLSNFDARVVARRFPPIFCYGIEGNLKPKMEFLIGEMGREVGEVKEFPQYFSFSLENRIRPRHLKAVEKGVRLDLAALLKPGERKLGELLERCVSSSPPLKWSSLWREGLDLDGKV